MTTIEIQKLKLEAPSLVRRCAARGLVFYPTQAPASRSSAPAYATIINCVRPWKRHSFLPTDICKHCGKARREVMKKI